MPLPFLAWPLIAAAFGAGTAKATDNDWKKGAMIGGGLGLGAGALAPAAAGGMGGWSALTGGAGAAGGAGTVGSAAAANGLNSAATAKLAAMNLKPAELALATKTGTAGLASSGAAGAGKAAGWSQLAKQAAVQTGVGTGLSAAMPQYGQTQLMANPGFLQPMQEDPTAQLYQLMQKKGRLA